MLFYGKSKNSLDIKKYIEKIENLVPSQMSETEQGFVLSTLEAVMHLLAEQSKLIQELKDEINRLKGEQGNPNIISSTTGPDIN